MTKTRTEHLTDADKEKSSPRSPIQSFLNIAEVEEKQNSPASSEEVSDHGHSLFVFGANVSIMLLG